MERVSSALFRLLCDGTSLLILVAVTFCLAPNVSAQSFSVLHTFTGGTDGDYPYGGVILDSAGNLYGTTQVGGTQCCGTVFRINVHGNKTVLHNFSSPPDGNDPIAALILDDSGNLYGTTLQGGVLQAGTVFEIGSDHTEQILASAFGHNDGPVGSLVRDAEGILYGTTPTIVFKLTKTGHPTVLHTFGAPGDGSNCQAGLLRDVAGNLYGTTVAGGAYNQGTVFKIDASGNERVLYSFTGGADGGYAASWLVEDAKGNLYGTTSDGGAYGYGTVFKLDSLGNETVLHSFSGEPDGRSPLAGLISDPEENLYGTTEAGGIHDAGTVFKLDPHLNETILHSFNAGGGGSEPISGVVRDSAGNLYGTTLQGGRNTATGCKWGCGIVYKISF